MISSLSSNYSSNQAPSTTSVKVETSFSEILTAVSSSTSLLNMTADTFGAADSSKPNMKEWMELTGVNAITASKLLYGVVGSNADYRDWEAIMTDKDPLAALKEANAQMYGGGDSKGVVSGSEMPSDLSLSDREGNFTVIESTGTSSYKALYLVDGEGNLLTQLTNTSVDQSFEMHQLSTAKEEAALFGFNTSALDTLMQRTANEQQTLPENTVNQTVNASASESIDETIEEPTLVTAPTTTTAPTTEVTTTSPITDSNLVALTNLYQSYLNREPDAGGLAYWTEKLNSGATLQEIENAFYLSEEFVSLSQGTTTPTTPTTTTPSSTASSIATALENATLEDLLKLV